MGGDSIVVLDRQLIQLPQDRNTLVCTEHRLDRPAYHTDSLRKQRQSVSVGQIDELLQDFRRIA